MFPLHSNYRRDGATRPLFRSRVSMMASAPSSCPDDEESSTRTSTSTSPTKTTTTTTTAGTFHRPRPRMWSSTAIPSSSSYLSSGSDYSDGYYSSDDSDSEDEADDMLCDASASAADMNDLMKGNINIKNKNNKKKRRPISPTSCTDFDNCEHDRPAKRRRRHRDDGSKHVTFARDPVADVRYRPRTPREDKRMLFYSKRDISGFRHDYYDWLDEGHDPSELHELNENDVEEAIDNVIYASATPTSSSSSTPKKSTTTTTTCVTPDNSSEDEDGEEEYEEEED